MKLPPAARILGLLLFCCLVVRGVDWREATVAAEEKATKEVAGKADVLRHVVKRFATLIEVDESARSVKTRLEGDDFISEWPLNADAEVKVRGWWGRLEQLQKGDRVWVWLAVDRKRQPKSIMTLADEVSEQDIHDLPYKLDAMGPQGDSITISRGKNETRTLTVAKGVTLGDLIYVQSAGGAAREIVTAERLETVRGEQQQFLRNDWKDNGLPGTVTFLHVGGEMEQMLDHEAIRWGRYLKPGDEVTILIEQPIKAVVKLVTPWRERTQLRLVTDSGVDQADLVIGQRVRTLLPEPPAEVQASPLPTDIGRLTGKQDRIDWFLCSTYCSCKVAGDRCTGMFYTLASCNVNACGMPNQIRAAVGEMIDKGMSDEEIFAELLKTRGSLVAKQHLLR